ncbi:MAG: hypothetical protein ABIH74_01710 [Candidatus Omnitrophota bacterium]
MLDGSIRVLDFDDSIVRQKRLLSGYKTDIIDLKDVGPKARFWMKRKDRDEIERRISSSSKRSVTFLGSGDFHHVSSILINSLGEEIAVIAFDLHPDWNTLPPHLGCGSWVTETLRNGHVRKHVMLGPSFDAGTFFSLQTGNLKALRENRVEIYPYSARPSTVFFKRVPPSVSINSKRNPLFTRIYWKGLEAADLASFFLDVIKRLPTKRVYITIDKDCLKKQHALTNWREGKFSMEELLLMLRLIRENLDVAGVDITGDYSKIHVNGINKKAVSFLNHPKFFSARGLPESYVTAVNEQTNLKIMQVLV